jgi:uncharacterized membrane protein
METMDILTTAFRWIHILAGILWIGILYWFNFVNIPFAPTMDGETKKKVVPELLSRALYFFRWGALWTWTLGFLLVLLVFYHGGLMFEQGAKGWGLESYVMVAVTFLMFFLYDAVAKSGPGKNLMIMGAIGFIVTGIVIYLMINWAEFSYRAYSIHIGAMFGTLMMMNVWMRIWPAQKKIIPAIKAGTAPDAALVAQTGQRSRHNTYMSVPLVWTMMNGHTVIPGAGSWLWLLGVILVGWLVVTLVYGKSTKVTGM